MRCSGQSGAVICFTVVLLASLAPTGALAQGGTGDPVIVGFHDAPDVAAVRAVGGRVSRAFDIVPAVAATLPPQAAARLARNPKVAYVEPDRTLYALAQTVPWGIARIGATLLHPSNTGAGVRVGVLDTGIDTGHPDVFAAGGYDFVHNDAIPDDENGHGTHVSGTVAALDNDFGVLGVGPDIHLRSYKFLDNTGSGSTSAAIAGIEQAIADGIDVLNMSYGSYYRSRAEEQALKNAYNNHDVVLVAACGNSGNTWKLYPAAYNVVIAVAATDQADNQASFSSFYKEVELAAPGVGVLSTMPTYDVFLTLIYGFLNNYDYLDGTSMATPHVAGAAALVRAANPGWSNVQIRDRLATTAIDLGDPGRDHQFGYGLVDAAAAAGGAPPPPPPPPPGATGDVAGTVTDAGGVVADAHVSLLLDGSTILKTRTDANGEYAFLDVSAGPGYGVKARKKNLSGYSGAIEVLEGLTTVVDILIQ